MTENSSPLPKTLGRAQVQETLKRISAELITAHRTGRRDILARFARQAGIPEAEWPKQPGKLFIKLIQIYHPDRLESMMERIASCQTANDAAGLAEIAAILIPATKPGRGSETGADDAGPVPEYVWQAADFGFGEGSFDDHLENGRLRTEERTRHQRPIDFIEALKREFFGNLDLHLSRLEMEELDGELELVDLGIGDLHGIQYCRNITGLNLSLNEIHDIGPLRSLKRLETLDLSGNQIEDADDLGNLRWLEELDLSDNQIEDIGFLENLHRLKVLNLRGNPIRDSAILAILRERGVLFL